MSRSPEEIAALLALHGHLVDAVKIEELAREGKIIMYDPWAGAHARGAFAIGNESQTCDEFGFDFRDLFDCTMEKNRDQRYVLWIKGGKVILLLDDAKCVVKAVADPIYLRVGAPPEPVIPDFDTSYFDNEDDAELAREIYIRTNESGRLSIRGKEQAMEKRFNKASIKSFLNDGVPLEVPEEWTRIRQLSKEMEDTTDEKGDHVYLGSPRECLDVVNRYVKQICDVFDSLGSRPLPTTFAKAARGLAILDEAAAIEGEFFCKYDSEFSVEEPRRIKPFTTDGAALSIETMNKLRDSGVLHVEELNRMVSAPVPSIRLTSGVWNDFTKMIDSLP